MKFEFEIKKLILIYFKSRQSFEIFKYLKRQDIINDQFWQQINYLSFKDTILELDKLLSDRRNQKFRLRKFIQKLFKSGEYRRFNFDEQTLLLWEFELKNFKPVLEKIANLRDEHFAHTDHQDSLGIDTTSIDYRNIFNDNEIEKLFNFIEKVLKKVNQGCGRGYLETELFFSEKTIKIIENLEELQKYRQQEFFDKIRNNKPSV